MWRRASSFVAKRLPVRTRLALLKWWSQLRGPALQWSCNPKGPVFSRRWGQPAVLVVGPPPLSLRQGLRLENPGEAGLPVAFAWKAGRRWLAAFEVHPQISGVSNGPASVRGHEIVSVDRIPRRLLAPLGIVVASSPSHLADAHQLAVRLGYLPAEQPLGNGTALSVEALRSLFPKVSILVTAYNQCERTRLCLETLYAFTDYPHWEVVVVDNASQDGTSALLQEWANCRSNFRLLKNPTNRGFPAACNQAAQASKGEILCFLNNDTVVTPGWLSALVDELLRSPRVGLVGPTSQGVANEARVKAPYRSLEELPLWSLARAQSYFRRSKRMPMLALFCAATWRRVWDDLEGLDEDFGIGLFEDDDFSCRLRERGYELRCRLDAFVHHFQGSSFSRLGDKAYWELYEHNRKLFWAKLRARRARG